jgi:hypothetical protein
MATRTLGGLVVVTSAGLLAFALVFLRDTSHMAETLAWAVTVKGDSLDAADWQHHWRINAFVMLAAGATGMLAGLGMLRRRRWSLAVLAGVAMGMIIFEVGSVASGHAIYGFERLNLLEVAIMTAIAVVSLAAYRRWPRPHS